MRNLLFATTMLVALSGTAWAESDPASDALEIPAGGATVTTTVTQAQAQQQQQQQLQTLRNRNTNTANGGAGGQGGAGGNANNNGVSQTTSFNDRLQAPALGVNAPGLAALATSECVLSTTWAAGGGVSVAGFGIVGTGGSGNTHPYDECNTRAAIQVLGQMHGSIQGVDVSVIIGNMAGSLTGVQAAIDKAKGKPAQASALAPAAATPVQTAEAAPICPANLPKVLLAQCQAK